MATKKAAASGAVDAAAIEAALDAAIAAGTFSKKKKNDHLLPFKAKILALSQSGASAKQISAIITSVKAGLDVSESGVRAFIKEHAAPAPAAAKPAASAPTPAPAVAAAKK